MYRILFIVQVEHRGRETRRAVQGVAATATSPVQFGGWQSQRAAAGGGESPGDA